MPADSFHPLGPAHVGILAAVPVLAAALASAAREDPTRAVWVRFGLASALLGDSLAWYAVTLGRGEVRPPHGLPLDLCDVMAWVTVYALVAGRAWALEGAYFLGLAGSGMALLTPDLRDKPQAETLLDLLGPWPVYILAAEPVALILLRALALPFQSGRPRMGSGPRIARA
jgi:uncharacterized membrane protein YwaF